MTAINRNTKVELVGRGEMTLRPADHVATGGEGSVYRAKNTIIKLFTDKNRMKQGGTAEKLNLLSKIKHPYIVSPSGLVLVKGQPAGYYMPFQNGEGFSRLFTSAFRQREGIDNAMTHKLVERTQEAVAAAHSHKAVLVDANELNWLAVRNKAKEWEPRVIDVDSWQIDKWPATAIMPSIMDHHTKGYSTLTDWFAWGIVSFQLYTGIHPYKGKLDGYKGADMMQRMKDNASVFTKGVKLNRAVRNFADIPGPLLDWYVAVFQKGERSMPPSPFATGVVTTQLGRVARMVTTAAGNLLYEKLFSDVADAALRIFSCGAVLLKSGRLVNLANKRDLTHVQDMNCEVIQLGNHYVVAERLQGQLLFRHINGVNGTETQITANIAGERLFRYANRLFVLAEQGLLELNINQVGNKVLLGVGQTWPAMPKSTRWFDGVGVQDTLGATFLLTPFSEKAFRQVRVKELDGLTPITAKAGPRFVALVAADKQGQYHKLEFTFNENYSAYTLWQDTVDTADLNVAILPKNNACVTANIVEDGKLNIFVPTSSTLNTVEDKDIGTDMLLANWEDKVIYLKDGSVWQVKMT